MLVIWLGGKSFEENMEKWGKLGENLFSTIFLFHLKEIQMMPVCKIQIHSDSSTNDKILKWIQICQTYPPW